MGCRAAAAPRCSAVSRLRVLPGHRLPPRSVWACVFPKRLWRSQFRIRYRMTTSEYGCGHCSRCGPRCSPGIDTRGDQQFVGSSESLLALELPQPGGDLEDLLTM